MLSPVSAPPRIPFALLSDLPAKNLRPFAATLLCLLLCACSPTPTSPRTNSINPRRATQPSQPYQQRIDRADRRGTAGSPGNFDLYLLNLSWSPEFCATHGGRPECAEHLGFVLHGLWPQNFAGSYPEHCSDAPGPDEPSKFRDLYPDAGLLRHEWQTHGTCSGLAPEPYFETARRAFQAVRIPNEISGLSRPAAMPPDAILGLFAKANPGLPRESLALSCGNNYLTAVEVCLSKDLKPVSCGKVRTCHANSVRIVPPATE